MVYDVAVYISLRLSNRFSISIIEDETAYIALHIGAELEGQKRNLSKIRTVLLCPKYMNLDEQLYEKLNHHFGNDLIIQTVVSKFSETEDLDFELLITTLPVPETPDFLVIEVSPIFTEEQRMTLITEIGNIRLDRKKSILRKNFDDYFNEKFFTSQLTSGCSEAVINELCQVLEAENIVKHRPDWV